MSEFYCSIAHFQKNNSVYKELSSALQANEDKCLVEVEKKANLLDFDPAIREKIRSKCLEDSKEFNKFLKRETNSFIEVFFMFFLVIFYWFFSKKVFFLNFYEYMVFYLDFYWI